MNETPLQQLLSITLIFISNQEKWKPIRHVLIRVLKLERLRTQLHHNHHQAHLRQSLHLNKKLHFCYHKLFPFSHFNQMLFIREYVFNLTKAHLGQSDTFSNLYKASSIWFLWLFQHVPIYLADRRCCGLRIVNTIYNSPKIRVSGLICRPVFKAVWIFTMVWELLTIWESNAKKILNVYNPRKSQTANKNWGWLQNPINDL